MHFPRLQPVHRALRYLYRRTASHRRGFGDVGEAIVDAALGNHAKTDRCYLVAVSVSQPDRVSEHLATIEYAEDHAEAAQRVYDSLPARIRAKAAGVFFHTIDHGPANNPESTAAAIQELNHHAEAGFHTTAEEITKAPKA